MATSAWESHKIYLLTGDMATIAEPTVLLFSIGAGAAGVEVKIALVYFVLLLAQYVLIAKAVHNYGNRFVLNVICEEASSLLCR